MVNIDMEDHGRLFLVVCGSGCSTCMVNRKSSRLDLESMHVEWFEPTLRLVCPSLSFKQLLNMWITDAAIGRCSL